MDALEDEGTPSPPEGNDYGYVEGAVGQVHFPPELYSHADLEDMLNDSPSPAKILSQDPEYLVQGNIEELRFIWDELNWKGHKASFDAHIIERF